MNIKFEEFLREFISTQLWKKHNYSDLKFVINDNGTFEVFDTISGKKLYGRR